MSPRCPILMVSFLAIAVPLTVIWWGGFWLIHQYWSALAWTPEERRMFRWWLLAAGLIVAELAVFVCVATDR